VLTFGELPAVEKCKKAPSAAIAEQKRGRASAEATLPP
jgi:hypothetical protein